MRITSSSSLIQAAALAIALATATSCSPSATGDEPDAGTVPKDGGAPVDAGSPSDAGSPEDGGSPPDAGPSDAPPAAYVANRFARATAAGGGDGLTADTAWTLVEAMALAEAGHVVEVGPGVYAAPGGGGRFNPAFAPARSGTADAPIVFMAQHPANRLDDASPLRTILQSTPGGAEGPVLGVVGQDHVVLNGFFIDEADVLSTADTGPVVFVDTTGSRLEQCRLIGDADKPWDGGDNHNLVRMEHTGGCKILDNKMSGDPDREHDMSCITLYDSEDYEIAHNEMFHINEGVYPKGDAAADHPPYPDLLNPGRIHHNLIYDVRKGFIIGGVKPRPGTAGFLDITQNVVHGIQPDGMALHIIAYDTISPSHLRVVNNTFHQVATATSEACVYVAGGEAELVGGVAFTASLFQNNIFVAGANKPIFQSYGASTAVFERATFATNLYDTGDDTLIGASDGSFTFAAWQGRGHDVASLVGPALLRDPAGMDFRLQSTALGDAQDSPCLSVGVDVLNLLGGGTAAAIPLGAYVLPDQSDRIGMR